MVEKQKKIQIKTHMLLVINTAKKHCTLPDFAWTIFVPLPESPSVTNRQIQLPQTWECEGCSQFNNCLRDRRREATQHLHCLSFFDVSLARLKLNVSNSIFHYHSSRQEDEKGTWGWKMITISSIYILHPASTLTGVGLQHVLKTPLCWELDITCEYPVICVIMEIDFTLCIFIYLLNQTSTFWRLSGQAVFTRWSNRGSSVS